MVACLQIPMRLVLHGYRICSALGPRLPLAEQYAGKWSFVCY
jgi:hypothetical protein